MEKKIIDEEIVYQGPGDGIRYKTISRGTKFMEPVEGYRDIKCEGNWCEDCPLTCAPECERWPGNVCDGCPCLTIDQEAIEKMITGVFSNF